MKFTRIFSLLMALLLCAGVFASCGEATGENTDAVETEQEPVAVATTLAQETTAEPEVTVAVEKLGTSDKPLTFNMLVRAARYAYLFTEEATGEMLNDSVYKRNAKLEEDYGIDITITECNSTAAEFTTKVTSGDGAYDLVCYDYWWNLDLQGIFTDLKTLPEINTDDEWWYHGWNDNVTINGKMYSIAGDANLEMLENLEVMFFNKNMAKDRNLDLYKEVSDGKWTVDKLIETVTAVTSGMDDNDKTNDIYGAMYDVHSICAQMYSCGMKIAEIKDGAVSIENAVSSSNTDIIDKLVTLMKTTGIDYSSATARARDWSVFQNGQSLIYATALYLGKSLKNAELGFDYGIIPLPKMSEDVDYISTSYGVSVFAIPTNAASAHNSALVMNAMNFHSGRTDESVVTTFYEIVLKYQVANSLEDTNNLDIVKNNIYIDFSFIYDIGFNTAYKNCVINKATSTAAVKAVSKSAQKTIENTIMKFYNS